jgi:hypothetical protein
MGSESGGNDIRKRWKWGQKAVEMISGSGGNWVRERWKKA